VLNGGENRLISHACNKSVGVTPERGDRAPCCTSVHSAEPRSAFNRSNAESMEGEDNNNIHARIGKTSNFHFATFITMVEIWYKERKKSHLNPGRNKRQAYFS
jgi:hypothetical protein